MLKGLPILIAEDNAIIAFHLAGAIEKADGRSLWPVVTTAQALEVVRHEVVRAALISTGFADIDRLVRILTIKSIPFLLYSSDGQTEAPPDLATHLPPPVKWSAVISVLSDLPDLLD